MSNVILMSSEKENLIWGIAEAGVTVEEFLNRREELFAELDEPVALQGLEEMKSLEVKYLEKCILLLEGAKETVGRITGFEKESNSKAEKRYQEMLERKAEEINSYEKISDGEDLKEALRQRKMEREARILKEKQEKEKQMALKTGDSVFDGHIEQMVGYMKPKTVNTRKTVVEVFKHLGYSREEYRSAFHNHFDPKEFKIDIYIDIEEGKEYFRIRLARQPRLLAN